MLGDDSPNIHRNQQLYVVSEPREIHSPMLKARFLHLKSVHYLKPYRQLLFLRVCTNIISNYLHFRVPYNESIFGQQQDCIPYESVIRPCECERDGPDKVIFCNPNSNDGLDKLSHKCVEPENGRRKRSTPINTYDDNVFPDEDIFVRVPESTSEPLDYTWPTPSGMTEAQAETACTESFTNSPVYTDCQSEVDTESMLVNCKLDILVSISLWKSKVYKV